MNFRLIRTFLSLALALGFVASVRAQTPVTTGIVEGVAPQEGIVTIRSDQLNRSVTFYGLEAANIFHVDGKPGLLSDIAVGDPITIVYAERNHQWYVSKVMLRPERPPVSRAAEPPVQSNGQVRALIRTGP